MVIKGITFNNIPDKKLGTKITTVITQSNVGNSSNEDYINNQNFYKLYNAIDIDWNGAEIDNEHVINDTSDLLNYIKSRKEYLDNKIGDLGTASIIYPFESWNNKQKEIKYGEGTVTVVEQRFGGATVKVLTNESTDPNAENFVGREFNVQNLDTTNPIQLYDGDNPIDIWVTVGEPTEISYNVKSYVDNKIDSLNIPSTQGLATETYVNEKINDVIGGAPENLDTIKELADVMNDLKVVDVEPVEPVEGVHFTQEEIDAAQEGDEAYGKTTDDWKIEPVEGVEEQSHNMTIKEFVNSAIQSVDEKAEIAKLREKYEALLTLLNIRDSEVNSVMINKELESNSNVTFDDPVSNVVIPETTSVYTVTAPLDDNSTVTLTSNKYMTLDNTSETPVSATIQRPAESSETGTSGTTVYLVGQYDTLTLENVSPNVKSGRDAATVNNVVISENNTKNLSLNLNLQDGATIRNNSATSVTINDKNNEETVLTIVAPNSTVTLNGGTYTTLDAEVSENTLIIKKNAHIGTLNVTKGNVKVEVARQSDIANVIDNLNIAEGYSVDYLHDEITSSNISKLNSTGTHVLQEDLTKTGNFSVGLFSSDDIIWDLNGHNITSSNTRGYGIFLLRGSAKLEINDTVGTGIVKNTGDDYGLWTSTVDSKVIINGGNFEASTHVLYAQKGTIEVNGGSFKLTNAATADKDQNGNLKFLVNCHDAEYVSGEAKIIVRGGTFYGWNPAESYGEPNGPVSFLAEGYQSIKDDALSTEYGMNVYKVLPIPVTE